jgi:hypothetical protein
MPGAYLVNGATDVNNFLMHLPIFGSIQYLNSMGFQDSDNIYYVMPGYRIELYSGTNYTGTFNQNIINTNGTKIRYVTASPADQCSSIKMFYKNVEIADKYTYTIYGNDSGSLTTIPRTTLTSGSYKLLNLSLFPGAYMINSGGSGCLPIFFSITQLNGFINQSADREDCVLVMPGYKLILYGENTWTGTYVAIDNTTGTTIIVGLSDGVQNTDGTTITAGWSPNTMASCRLYFDGNEVTQASIADITTS